MRTFLLALIHGKCRWEPEPEYTSQAQALYHIRTRLDFGVRGLAGALGISAAAITRVENECERSFSASILDQLSDFCARYRLRRAAEYWERQARYARLKSYRQGGRR